MLQMHHSHVRTDTVPKEGPSDEKETVIIVVKFYFNKIYNYNHIVEITQLYTSSNVYTLPDMPTNTWYIATRTYVPGLP